MGTHRNRAPVGRIALLGLVALAVLFAALAFRPLSLQTAHAQANSPPEFASEATDRAVDENTLPFASIGAPITATDPDSDTLTYSLENASVSHFGIDSATGQLLVGSPFDHEMTPSYPVKVIATDPSGAKDTIDVTITINDVDEAGTVALSWKQPQVGTVLDAVLTDPDGDVSGTTWQWSWSSTKGGDYSDIGVAALASYTPVTGDVDKHLRATASYTDGEGSGKTAHVVSYRRVRAAPTDNSPPEFPEPDSIYFSGGYACPGSEPDRGVCLRVPRSKPVGAEIYQPARAQDPDGDEVRYSLEGDDTEFFGIMSAAGYLLKKILFMKTDNNPYTVMIKATDPSGEFDTIKATITPSGGRLSPVVVGPDEIKYPENGSWRVAAYTAENVAGAVTGWIISVQPGGGDGDYFDINDGVLTFKDPPDYEDPKDEGKNNEYSFSITAYKGKPNQTFFNVTVIVVDNVDEPDPPAMTITGPDSVDYSEHGTDAVATYEVANAPNNPVDWTLSGDDAGDFSILGGVLTFDTPPDREVPADADTNNVYLVTVEASTGGNTVTLDVEVTVTEVNEAPAFPDDSDTRSILENTQSGEPIGDPVKADDPEGNNLKYSLGGKDADSFDIDPSTGQLMTKAPLDHEEKDTYTVDVSVSEDDGNSGPKGVRGLKSLRGVPGVRSPDAQAADSTTITINVEDQNEPPEVAGLATVDYAENGEGEVATYTASDPEGANITWSLSGDDAEKFSIDDEVLKFITPPDYETPGDANTDNEYLVTIEASDGTRTDTIDVTVTVTDVNELPAFSETPAIRTVDENTETGQDIGDPFAASDLDDGATLTYTLGGIDVASFDIDTSSGQLLTKAALDYETKPSYTVKVSVRDSKDAHGNTDTRDDATITVTINVTNVDEDGEVTFSSNQPQVGTALTAMLDDPDGGTVDITWLWESSSNQSDWTAIDGETLASYTPVDGDVDNYLRLNASYTDGQGPGKTAVAEPEAAVRSVPVTNEAPEFQPTETGARSVAENTAAGVDIGAPVVATDDDNDTLTYSLDESDTEVFHIVPESGQLQTKGAVDHEANPSYTVTVTATDPSNATHTIDVTITVTDVPEPPAAPARPKVEPAATDGHNTLDVSWEAPDVTGKPDITEYEVRYQEQGADGWGNENVAPPTGTSATISELTPGMTYEVQVQAINDEGSGGWSEPGVGSTASLTVAYGQAHYSVNEGQSVEITVTLSPAAAEALGIPISITSSNAEAGDYEVSGLTDSVLTVNKDIALQTFTIIAKEDRGWRDEALNLGFGQLPPSVTAGSQKTATVIIYDNDTRPSSGSSNNNGGNSGGGNSGGGGSSNSGGNTRVQTQSSTPVTPDDEEPPEETTPVEEEVDNGVVDDGSGVAGEANQPRCSPKAT